MSSGTSPAGDVTARPVHLDLALASVAGGAAELDRVPGFPRESFFHLAEAGALTATVGSTVREAGSVRPGWDLLRRVSAADASVGRILDGHQNAIERLEVAAEPQVRERELAAVSAGKRLLGVWGADPATCGSHPFVTGGRLDRARRDLETFLLQHRLEPLLARLGRERLAQR